MIRHVVRLLFALPLIGGTIIAAGPLRLAAQQQGPTTITGRVTDVTGAAIPLATVAIEGVAGGQTRADGRYTVFVPAARVTTPQATLSARAIGFKTASVSIQLVAGTMTQDFQLAAAPMRLEEVVVTGAGTSNTREKLATAVSTVTGNDVTAANAPYNLVTALAGQAPGVDVRTQGGDPGSSASIIVRGRKSIANTNQPLFVVDGQPIDNTTVSTDAIPGPVNGGDAGGNGGTVEANRAADINPADIESITILKGSAASAVYGARAANGVVLITTKSGHAGQTHYSLQSNSQFDNVSHLLPLQRSYGLGSHGVSASCTTPDCSTPVAGSWGPLLAPGTPTFDHASELFRTGTTFDNTLSVSGGTDRTTFFVSGGQTRQEGILKGPNNNYVRTNARVKGQHQLWRDLTISGNIAYTDGLGAYTQKGSNTSGVMLGALRTPPNFNNQPYLDPVSGLQRSYRFPHPTTNSLDISRGYDNPFWDLNNTGNKSELGRAIGNVNIAYTPLDWLSVTETFGVDYYDDWRLETNPTTSSSDAFGNITRFEFNNQQIDNNLVVTARHEFASNLLGTITVGQNINARRGRLTNIFGEQLIAPVPYALENTTSWLPKEFRSLQHIVGFFGQGEIDLFKQLYLTGGGREDGFSTFGSTNRYSFFPKASAAWTFTHVLGKTDDNRGLLSYGKLRAAYGETGVEPPVYATSSGYDLIDAFGSGFGDYNSETQNGHGGLVTGNLVGNPNLLPERTREVELGSDLAFFDAKVDLGVTYFHDRTTADIVEVPINASGTGSFHKLTNGANLYNRGWELTLDLHPIALKNFTWDIGAQYAGLDGHVTSIQGAQFIPYNLEGFTGSYGATSVGYPIGVIRGQDFVRCGYHEQLEGQSVDALCKQYTPNYKKGALYIRADGLPVVNPLDKVIGNPNPQWTGGLRTGLTFFHKLRLSGQLDIRNGGEIWDGTLGALYRFGTTAGTLMRNQTGTFGVNVDKAAYPNVAGPGAGKPSFTTPSQWQAWWQGLGGSASDAQRQFIESGSFTKLREVAVSYSFDGGWVQRIGLSSVDLRLSGRNLVVWTKYKGFDPESNVGGAEFITQGFDYFNNPQLRSFVISVGLNR